MVRETLTLGERWQAVGMLQVGFSKRRVAGQMGVHYSALDRLMQRLKMTVGICDQ
jgi:IS30 family transposase